jgi:hypothetical protein
MNIVMPVSLSPRSAMHRGSPENTPHSRSRSTSVDGHAPSKLAVPNGHPRSPLSESPHGSRSPTVGTDTGEAVIKRAGVGGKPNVSSACGPCKKAHLACDVARPCKRCVNMGKDDLCEDVPVGLGLWF